MRVAVIGAGGAGLVALRHLTRHSDVTAVAFEAMERVGGTWIYTEQTGLDQYGRPIQSSMYKNLRTNLPKEVMAFPDFPFQPALPSFLSHRRVLEYLQLYAENYSLLEHIKFSTEVTDVRPGQEGGWEVRWRTVGESHEERDTFHAVFVCNGHFALPLTPDVKGRGNFRGRVSHSHDYRSPEVFSGLRVVCLGAASSGIDICIEVASRAQEVILSHNKPIKTSILPTNVRQASGVVEFTETGVVLRDGETYECDAVIMCTGYRYEFPFLSPSCHPDIKDERVFPLYKHVIHAKHPTIFFIGINKLVCPFPLFHCQALFALKALFGEMKLPSEADMLLDVEKDYQWRLSRGMPGRYAHHMGPLQWGYNDELADLGGFERIPRVVHRLYDLVHDRRAFDSTSYKNDQFELVDEEEFRELDKSLTR